MRLLGRILVVVLAVIGGGFLLIGGIGLYSLLHTHPAPLPSKMVLALDLDRGVSEAKNNSPFALRKFNAYPLRQVVETLDRAARDPAVTALVARFDSPPIGMAQAQELRDAVLAFRRSGKRVMAYSTSLGGGGNGNMAYYLASSFHEIWLQPSGDIGLTGFMAESPFFKGVLDWLEVKPQFAGRYEYKTAIDIYTHDKFTKEGRESMQMLIDSWSKQTIDGIALARGLPPAEVKSLIDRAPLMADEALNAKLVDKLAYWDEAEKDLTADESKLVDLSDYAARAHAEPTAVKVALIGGIGDVTEGDGGDGPFGGASVMSSLRLERAFKDAIANPDIKAILFRIDSPGGAYPAADDIWHTVTMARAAGKPVVVSMGNVAASGGYYGAMAADKIVAQPGTITGSIGVFSGKLAMADAFKKIGITFDEVHQGKNAGMWSGNSTFTPSQWDRLNFELDHTYADFTGKAEKARNLTPEAMDKLARGRIWPGDEAKRVGLVDELGGYPEALVLIRQLAKLPTQMPIQLVPFPREKKPIDYLLELAEQGELPDEVTESAISLQRIAKIAAYLEPLTSAVESQTKDTRLKAPAIKAE
jgi:protease-4